jgi:predicted unusual protein kinase regulating ubiquinone biosynthesis (AarF/ABC1/UbiB family)
VGAPSRLFTVYWVTLRVSLSYLGLAVARRFRGEEAIARLTRAKHRRNALRIEAAIVRLRGLFIKVGQLISIMANFLPDAFRDELEALQDQVPPRPYDDIQDRLRREFGKSPSELFAEFAAEPVASASIGQVHRARLHSGEEVAVKVQYVDIEQIVRTDLRALRRIVWLLRWVMPDYGFDTIYQEIRGMVLSELDYRKEADAIRRISANFKARGSTTPVRIPRVIDALSSERVLTTEWISGIRIADLPALARAGLDTHQLAHTCVQAFCEQIFVDGDYHADPHPGNLLVQATSERDRTPVLVFLDFGATAQVSEAMRRGMVSFLQGAMARDTTRIVAAMKEMGFISRRADPEVFDRVVEYFHERLRGEVRVEGFSLKDLKFQANDQLGALLDLRSLNVSLADLKDAFQIPKEWILLERALLLLLGVCTTLDPNLNPAPIIQPYLERFLLGEKREWQELALDAGRETLLSALSLPGQLQRFMSRALRGDLDVRVSNLGEQAELLYLASEQRLWGTLLVASLALAVVFDGRGQSTGTWTAASAAVVLTILLLLSRLAGRRRLARQRVARGRSDRRS